MQIKRISIISPRPNLPVGSRYDFNVMPVFGPLLISTILKNHGYEVKLFEESVWRMDWDYILNSDAVGFFVMTVTVRRTMAHCQRIRTHNPHIPIFIGGTHASELPEDTLRFADFVVRKEGDETILDLLEALQSGKDLAGVLGLSFKRDGKIIHNSDRPFVKNIDVIPDMTVIHGFRKEALWKRYLQVDRFLNLIQATRGCPFTCSFCYGIRDLGVGYRMRSIDSIINEIKYRIEFTGSRRFLFVDNHFVANPKFTRQLLTRMKQEEIHFTWCMIFTRIEIYKYEDILRLMEDVGITDLFIGLESFNDASLSYYNKQQSRKQMIFALDTIKKHRLRITGGFIYGTDTDTLETSRETIDMALKYGVHYASTLSLMEFPNISSPGLIPPNRMIIRDYDYCSGYFVCHFPKNMRPSVLQRELIRARRHFYLQKVLEDIREFNIRELYIKLASFPAARRMLKHWKEHIAYLEIIEQDMYDANDQLIETRLADGIFPPDALKAWLPEVQANIVQNGTIPVPTGFVRIPVLKQERVTKPRMI